MEHNIEHIHIREALFKSDANAVPGEFRRQRPPATPSVVGVWSQEADHRPPEMQEQLDHARILSSFLGDGWVEKRELSSVLWNLRNESIIYLSKEGRDRVDGFAQNPNPRNLAVFIES